MKSRYVCAFNDRNTVTAENLGTKGVNFAEMSQAGIPVPAGFTVTTDSCARYYDDNKIIADEIVSEIKENINRIEILTGKTLGGASNPLLLSVRSNSRQSVPGLMETILHLGMNDTTAEALSIRMSDPKTAYEYYLNFISVYSAMVKRFGKKQYAGILEDYKTASGKFRDEDLSLSDLKELILLYKESYKNGLGENFPSDPFVQLINAVGAGFHYWDSPRANYYRMVKEIPYSWGTAVTVQTMVYGNFLGERSGTGVAFTRNPSDGKKERLGEFLLNSRTGDVLSGNRTPDKLDVLLNVMPDVYEEFERDCFLIENKYRDIYEINFTIEDGNFFIIKTRKAKRTALAAFTAACDFTDEGMCSEKDAIKVLDPANITALRPTSGYEQLFEEGDDDVSFETQEIYASDKTAAQYVSAVTETDETPGTDPDEMAGGIYNYSLFDYELDDIMTEIYSGFNVYDEDIDDRSLTDELKRIVTERIPTLNLEDLPEETEEEADKTAPEDLTDDLPEIEAEGAAYTEYSGYKESSEMAPVGLFNDAFKSAREMAEQMNIEPDDYPDEQAADEDSYYDEDSDNYYKTKAFSDELSAVEEELAEEDIEERLENIVSSADDDELDVEALEEIPEELDPEVPLPEPPLTTVHTEETYGEEQAEQAHQEHLEEPQFTPEFAAPKTGEPLGAHKRHILATSPLDRIFSVITGEQSSVPVTPAPHIEEPAVDDIMLDDISETIIESSPDDSYSDDDSDKFDVSKERVKDDGSVYREFSADSLINAIEEEENYAALEFDTDVFDEKDFNPEDEINIPDKLPIDFSDDGDDGFLFDEDFDYEDDIPLPSSFGDEIETVTGAADTLDAAETEWLAQARLKEAAMAAEEVTDETLEVADDALEVADDALEVADDALEVADDTMEVTDEALEVADDTPEVADETLDVEDDVLDVIDNFGEAALTETPAKTPVSADELFGMIKKATTKPHKIKVTPVRRK